MVGGVGAQPGLEDVVRVARGELAVVLDTAACERIKKESPPPAKARDAGDEDDDPAPPAQEAAADYSGSLTVEQLRAALLARLLPLVNGRSKVDTTRLRMIQWLHQLQQLLASNSYTCLPQSSE